MRKRKLLLSAILSLGVVLDHAFSETQDLTLNKGWNLKGTYLDNVAIDNLNSDAILAVWKWVGNKWAVWSPNPQIQEIINKYIESGALEDITQLNAGEGFWVYANNDVKVIIEGILPTDTKLFLNDGWNLVALKSLKPMTLTDLQNLLSNTDNTIVIIWKWVGNKWAVWSPNPQIQEIINKYIESGVLTLLDNIAPGEGFWIYTTKSFEFGSDELPLPPTVGVAYLITDELNAIPLKDAEVYVNGQFIGKTNEFGEFDSSKLKDGDLVTIKKPGVIPITGKVKNGSIVLLTQKDTGENTPLTPTAEDFQKPANKIIASKDGSIALIISKYQGPDITVSVVPLENPLAVPPIEEIENAPTEDIKPENLAIISGFLVKVEDSQGTILTPDELQNIEISYNLKISKFLGDIATLLNGMEIPTPGYQEFTENVYKKLLELLENGNIDFVVLQYINGKWVYKGNAVLKPITVINKYYGSYTKYFFESENALDSLTTTVIALKLNSITGNTTVCVTEGGYKMFDGSIVTAPDNNSPDFDWIGQPIAGVAVLGDSNVQNGPFVTDNYGCIEVQYKVPFVKPTFTLSFKKKGYFDQSITCEVTPDGAYCPEVKMYRIPETASIEGYVLNKLTKEGIPNALVTLVNPEVLAADKIKLGQLENGTAFVEIGYMPNVEYTWTAVKYDPNGNKVAEVLIKQGSGSPEFAKLTEDEIREIFIKPLDENGSLPVDPKYLLGKWELHVKAVHKFTNTDQVLVEEAIGSFNIDILIPKLAELMGGQISEKQQEVIISDNGTLVEVIGLDNLAIYGGPSLGFLYAYGPILDEFIWKTQLLGAGVEDITGCIDDPIANQYGECYIDIANKTLTYNKALYPVSLNVKFIAENFDNLLKPDPACLPGEECYGQPFIKTGFTIRTLFEGAIYLENSTHKKLVASYVDVPYDLNRKINDLVDILKFELVAPSVTAYLRQVITENDGYYRINMIPPNLSGQLEIFAKAEGYKFDSNADIKLVNDLAPGKVSIYNLELEPINANVTSIVVENKIALDFDKWNLEESCSEDVKWQIIVEPETITVADTSWALQVWGTENVSLLPDSYQETEGYLWFGNSETGTYASSNGYQVCGKAISEVINLENMTFPVLKFLSWFEVESVDIAKGMFDQMYIGFILPKEENGNADEVVVYTSKGEKIVLKTDKIYSITVLNPEEEPIIQDANIPYSNQGVNALPIWKEYVVPIEPLAGLKVKFVFYFNSVDGLYNEFRGWGIDKIEVVDSLNETLTQQISFVGSIEEILE